MRTYLCLSAGKKWVKASPWVKASDLEELQLKSAVTNGQNSSVSMLSTFIT